MGEYKSTIITKKAHDLIAKLIASTADIEFTRVCASSKDYSSLDNAQLEKLTEIEDIKQETLVSSTEYINNANVNVNVAFDNLQLTEGYYMKTIALYANDNGTEILYSVTPSIIPNYMPPFNGKHKSDATFDLITVVSNADNVQINVNPSAHITSKVFNEFKDNVNSQLNENTNEINTVKTDYAKKTYVNTTLQTIETKINSIASASPNAVSLIAHMTDTTKNYVYVGNETGYINGNWYYHNGTSWVSGGIYQSTGISYNSVGDNRLTHSYLYFEKDLNTYTNKSDNISMWIEHKPINKGFIEQIKIDIKNNTDLKICVFDYTNLSNSITLKALKTYEFTNLEVGINYLDINLYVNNNFVIGLYSSSEQAYCFKSDDNYSSAINKDVEVGNIITSNPTKKGYSFNFDVIMSGVRANVERLSEIAFNLSKDFSLCKLSKKSAYKGYPITFNFENKTLTIGDLYLYDHYNCNRNFITYPSLKGTYTLEDLPDEGYYVVWLLYDKNQTTIKLIYTNGESLIYHTDKMNLNNYGYICAFLTNGRTYANMVSNPNSDLINIKLYNQRNEDDGTRTKDIIIPKFAERTIINDNIVKNKWFGKIVNCIGDSVVKGENSADSYLRMKDDNIASILQEEFGFSLARNYGIGGSRITSHTSSEFSKYGIIDRYDDMDNADLIIVWGGTNDFGASIQLGDLSDLTDNKKFKPAFYNLINGLITKYNGSQILVITPMHRKDGHPDNVANGAGLTLKDYRDAEIEICELLGIPVLDIWKELGGTPFNSTFKSTYMPDGLHPSISGMRTYVGRKLCNYISNI